MTSGKYPTNYQNFSNAILLGPRPATGTYIDAQGDPNVFRNPGVAIDNVTFRYPYAGEAGQRNNFRGAGYFGIDGSLAKIWKVTESQSLRFAWDVFNITNSVRFDVATVGPYLSNAHILWKIYSDP